MTADRWFSDQVLNWYATHGRQDLPWKKPISAYRVWVSEIMLQQTQVATVIPYFKRFMKAFPTLETLANASLDEVLHYWSGLGYYARGRNLHKTACIVQTQYHGQLPADVKILMRLPGIGRSTAGAIAAQSFNLWAPILDGNVKRVLCRFYAVPGWYGQKDVEQHLWMLAENHTPSQQVADYTQAMMDLGATVCTRSAPNCTCCPLQPRCKAYAKNAQQEFPHKKAKKSIPTRQTVMLCVRNAKQEILLYQRPLEGIWGGLWSLPEFKTLSLARFFLRKLGLKQISLQEMSTINHTFTHFHLQIQPWLAECNMLKSEKKLATDFAWINKKGLAKRGFPAPIKKLLNHAMR